LQFLRDQPGGIAGQVSVEKHLLGFGRISRHHAAYFRLMTGIVESAAALVVKKDATPLANSGAVEKVTLDVPLRPGKIVRLGQLTLDEVLSFVGPDIRSKTTAVVLARKNRAIPIQNYDLPTHSKASCLVRSGKTTRSISVGLRAASYPMTVGFGKAADLEIQRVWR
jgi:hypothetical protein